MWYRILIASNLPSGRYKIPDLSLSQNWQNQWHPLWMKKTKDNMVFQDIPNSELATGQYVPDKSYIIDGDGNAYLARSSHYNFISTIEQDVKSEIDRQNMSKFNEDINKFGENIGGLYEKIHHLYGGGIRLLIGRNVLITSCQIPTFAQIQKIRELLEQNISHNETISVEMILNKNGNREIITRSFLSIPSCISFLNNFEFKDINKAHEKNHELVTEMRTPEQEKINYIGKTGIGESDLTSEQIANLSNMPISHKTERSASKNV